MSKVKTKSITEFCDQDYLNYAMYVVEHRAIPSVIDGFKPTQRKAIYVANKIWGKAGSKKALKVFQLGGKVSSDAFYHHGDCLAGDTTIKLSGGKTITLEKWYNENADEQFYVYSFNEKTGKIELKLAHSPRIGQTTNEYLNIVFENSEEVECTFNHPFLVKTIDGENVWRKAGDLFKGDRVIFMNGVEPKPTDSYNVNYCSLRITNISTLYSDEQKPFYDITVNDNHNFFIEDSGICVHNSGMNNTIIGMAQDFKNNMPVLQGVGQFGSLRSPEAGAPRYVGVTLHKNFHKLYKDFELLEDRVEEGYKIEPKFFLPIVPTVLLNGSSGIAVGFATKILNRNLIDLINACLKVLDDKKIPELKPAIKDFHGTYTSVSEDGKKWQIDGKHTILNTTSVKVSELPPSMTYEKYEAHLNKLMAKKIISSYEDSSSDNIDYTIKIRRADLERYIKADNLIGYLKLREHDTENFTVLNEHGKLRVFNSAREIVKFFVSFRLEFYEKRKQYLLKKLTREFTILSNKAKFIKDIVESKLEIKNVPRKKIEDYLKKNKYDLVDESYDYLLNMRLDTLTKEKYKELLLQLEERRLELEKIKELTPKVMYREDLLELKKIA